jgi:Ca2+-binding EF-hand superfamily protein
MTGSKCLFLLTCFTIGTAAWAMTGAYAQQAATELPDPMEFGVVYEELAFEAADTDGNNLISEGEFVRDAAAGFSGLDRNRDGKLTPDELGSHDPAKFARVDANGDGMLTFNEVMTYKMRAFEAADESRDSALSFDEMVKSVTEEEGHSR